MSWRRVFKSLQQVAAHALLFSFTLLLVLKLDNIVTCSWWVIFFPLWLFHAVVARGRFSLPAPSIPHGRHWAPCHAVIAVPLLVAFELLLCIYLESTNVNGLAAVNLKIVFLPLVAFEVIVLVDNFRMCKALLPGDDENMSDEAIWETLPRCVFVLHAFPEFAHILGALDVDFKSNRRGKGLLFSSCVERTDEHQLLVELYVQFHGVRMDCEDCLRWHKGCKFWNKFFRDR